MKRNRRRRKLVRLDLQLKIVFITLFVASLVLLINFQLTLAGLWSLSNQFLQNKSVDMLLEGIRSSAIQKFFISVCLAVPLAASVGILYSFKFCGPIYRFKMYLTDLRKGRWDTRCMLRRNDDLQDVCEAINGAVEAFRSRVRDSHDLLQEVDACFGEIAQSADPEAQARVSQIREKIDTEDHEFRQRFGVRDEPAVEGQQEKEREPQRQA